MLPVKVLLTIPLLFCALSFTIASPARVSVLQPDHPSTSITYDETRRFAGSETVFGIAKRLARLQRRKGGISQSSRRKDDQVISQDLVSTQLYLQNITFSLSVDGGMWGYNQRPGYYRLANDTVLRDSSLVDIGNDIVSLRPNELRGHIFEAVDNLNNLTYAFLDVNICGGAGSLSHILSPVLSGKTMTAYVSDTLQGVDITLRTGAAAPLSASLDSIPASAVAFLAVLNNSIIHRISALSRIDLVDAFIIEIYVALVHRIAQQAQMSGRGGCVALHNVIAGMDLLSVTLGELMNSKVQVQTVQEL